MQIAQDARTCDTNIDTKPTEFKIAATAKAFQILSANMYTDRILAIVRELICNAVDAHTVAGKADVPIEVHLPASLDTEFRVKDFGTGLSHEAILTLYSTYFDSDKTHTNDLIGGLGIGSKSPFSYTDQFTVKSRYHGVLRTYQAYIGPLGVPAIMQVGAASITDECDGLEVVVPCKPDDSYLFRNRYIDFASWMPVPPVCPQLALEKREHMSVIELGDDMRFYVMNKGNANGYHFRVRQGLVTYTQPCDYDTPDVLRNGLFEVPIGTFDIAPSRETLSITEKQRELLSRIVSETLAQVNKEAMRLIGEQPDVFNAMIMYRDFTASLGSGWAGNDGATWTHPTLGTCVTLSGRGLSKHSMPNDGKICTDLEMRSKYMERGRYTQQLKTGHYTVMAGEIKPPQYILWAPKRRAYVNYMKENYPLAGNNYLWLAFGSREALEARLKFYGIDSGEIIEIPVQARTPGAQPATRAGYEPTPYYPYNSSRGYTEYQLKEMLADDEPVIVLPMHIDDRNIKQLIRTAFGKDFELPLAVRIDTNHTGVRKRLLKKGAMDGYEQLIWELFDEETLKVAVQRMLFSRCAQLRIQYTGAHPIEIVRDMSVDTAASDDELAALHARVKDAFMVNQIYLDGDLPRAAGGMMRAATGEGHLYTQLDFEGLFKAAKDELETLESDLAAITPRFPAIFSPSSQHTQLLWKIYIDHTNKEQGND